MEKYDDLIVSLIKKHRKYPEYELLLDDIVAEVKSKSASVLSSVPNEDVVESYLTKIVATAMITVPKRAGFAKSRETVMPDFSVNVQKEPVFSESANNEISLEEEEEENSLLIQELSDDDGVDEPEDLHNEPISESELSEETSDESLVENDLMTELEEDNTPLANTSPEQEQQESELVAEQAPELEVELESELEPSLSLEPADNIEEIEENVLEPDTEPLELSLNEDAKDPEEQIDEILDSSEKESDVDKSLVDKMINGVGQEDELSSDISDNLDLDIQDDLLSEGDFSLEVEEVEETEFEPAEDIETSTNAETPEQRQIGPSFDRFYFEPEEEIIDEDSCLKDLEEYQGKNPQKHITDICLLKYKENKTVDEICTELNLSPEEVLDTLEEIVDLVKG